MTEAHSGGLSDRQLSVLAAIVERFEGAWDEGKPPDLREFLTQAGDEVILGKALADAAKRSGTMQHFIYSSMPDHSVHNPQWPALPLWACKFAVENYIRQLGLPATFVYAGIYTNNFTSLPYPLFCMELKDDDTFEWRAPFHPDIRLPWLDVEHDLGPAVLQIFIDGPKKWHGHRCVAHCARREF